MGRRVRPGLIPSGIVAAVLVAVSWCLVPDHEVACVVAALGMPVLVPFLLGKKTFPDLAMTSMVGGTAGGLLGGIVVRLYCAPPGMMPIMMASMAGMVGGTLCGWGVYGRS